MGAIGIRYFFALITLGCSFSAAAAGLVVRGQLFERGSRVPLREVSVYILPHKLKAVTDESGKFAFEDVPEGEFDFIVNQTGYEKLEVSDSTKYRDDRILFLEKLSYTTFETRVIDQRNKKDEAKKTLKQEDFLTLPGAGGDPVKAVQNLPGVNRVAGFSSHVVIQGSAPKDTRYDVDGHEIPIVFHFGGLTSVVMPEAIESVDYYSAGFGAEYSRAMGGIVSLQTRDPDVKDRDRKSFFFVDNLKTGGLVEGRINDHSSYLISGRYSYVGLFLKTALKKDDAFDLTVAPEFSDLTIIYKNKLNEMDDFKLDILSSRDSMDFLFKEPYKEDPSIRGNFRNETNFFRVIPQWNRKLSSEKKVHLSAGLGQDILLIDVGDNYLNMKSQLLSMRAEYEQQLSSVWKSQVGIDNIYDWHNIKLKLPVVPNNGGVRNPISSSAMKEAEINSESDDLGLYCRNEFAYSETLQLVPDLRIDKFSLTSETVLSPRLGVRFKQNSSLIYKASVGLYYQPPQGQEVSVDYGNPDVKAPSAIHSTLGLEKDFKEGSSEGFKWTSGLFRKDFRNLVVPSSNTVLRDGVQQAEVYNNSGGGYAQGFENMLGFDFQPWSGWVSYTLSQSQRWDPSHPVYNFQYDQTHNFNLVASYDYGHNYKYSGRFRYVSGNPYTPIVSSVFDADSDVYIPVRGAYFSERHAAFQQLDLRVDKKWILDTEIWSVYLDIQNVLNTKNSEDIRYSYDYSQKESVTGLPILPALGIKGEF